MRGQASGSRESGPLAQLVEQLTLNQRVGGSSPPRPTTKPGHFGESRGARRALSVRVLSAFGIEGGVAWRNADVRAIPRMAVPTPQPAFKFVASDAEMAELS